MKRASLLRGFGMCAVCALFLSSAPAFADSGVDWLPVGDLQVLVVPDADITMEQSLLPGLNSHPEFLPLFRNGPLPAVDRTYYFKSGNHGILVDTGWGRDGKVRGATLDFLREHGIKPEDITDILLTHMDMDHIGGLLAAGKPVFPKAIIHVSKPEYDAWKGGNLQGRPRAARELAVNVLAQYGDRVKTFNFGDEILPGITAVDASGHTPGHTAFDISSGNQKLTVAGDLIHIAQVQLPLPELGTIYDLDMDKAAASRVRLLDRAAAEGSIFAGMHMPMISDVCRRPDHGYMMMEPRGAIR